MCYEIQEGGRQIAILRKLLHKNMPLPLGEFAAIFVQEQWKVPKMRRLPAECPVEEEVFGSGGEPFSSTQNMTDLHQVIIHHVSQVIGWKAIALQNHRITFHTGHLVPAPPMD